MEIIRRNKVVHKFEVKKPFSWGGRVVQVGEELVIDDLRDQADFVQSERVVPTDIPPTGIYIALIGFVLGGLKEKFECKPMEVVEIKSVDALPLMLEGKIIPYDPDQWRPFGRKLKTKGVCRGRKSQREIH